MKPIEFTDANFAQEVLSSHTPVLVDFWAPWCGPCRAIAPVVEDLARDFAGKMKVGKVDVDQNSDTASQFGVRNIPTLLVFKNGKVIDQFVGALPKAKLMEKLQPHLV